MAVRRRFNVINQMRWDVPHMRSIESAVSNDFDELLSSLVLGESQSYIARGFEINMVGAVGASANGLQLIVENSSVLHGKSTVSGTFLMVPDGTANEILNSTVNEKVDGSFTPSSLNYIGLEYSRAVDDTTLSQVYLWNPTSQTETTKTLPLAQILNYTIVITSSIYASNVLPIAIVETDSANNVLSVIDQRPMLFRLGTAGVNTPNPDYEYPWTNHTEGRTENHWQSSSSTSPFRGGDKQIMSLKEWMDAIMTEFKLIKGTPRWNTLTSNISIDDLYADLANLKMTGRGSFFHSESVAGQINWDRDFYLRLIGSRLSFRVLANLTSNHITLADGEVAYLELERDVEITPNLIFTNGSAVVSSVGAVSWTNNVTAGDFIKLGSANKSKYYQILTVDSVSQVTLTVNYQELSTGSAGDNAVYTWGWYETSASPSTKRHIKIADREDVPFDGNVYWLFFRDDNGASIAKIYIRMGGGSGELEQGESVQISDEVPQALLDYIGSRSESDSDPNYSGSVNIKEVTEVEFDAQSKIAAGQYWLIESAGGTQYYVWYTFNSVGVDPAIVGRTGVQVDLSASGDTENQVATKTQLVIEALADFTATVSNNVVTIEDANNGTPADASNGNMGGAFYITIPTEGDVSTKFNQQNYNTIEGENLTRRAARLTAMMADKAQDKTIGFTPDYKSCAKATNGANQEIGFANTDEDGNVTTPYLYISIPSSSNNMTIELTNGPVSLAVNQVAYFTIDRNASSSIDLSNLTIVSIGSCPLNENVFIFAYRLADTTVWLWDGQELIDGDNPSLSAFSEVLASNAYQEPIYIIAGAPSTDNELTGPISAGTAITLPDDSRDSGSPQGYVVGKGVLDVYLNGIPLLNGVDFIELGPVGSANNQFQIDIDLVIGDILDIRIKVNGGYTGVGTLSSGESNAGVNVGTGAEVYQTKSGVNLLFRTLVSGANIIITENTNEIVIAASGSTSKNVQHINSADYVITDIDGYDVLLVTTGASDRLMTLPTASANNGRTIVVKKIDAGIGYVRIRAEGAEAIDDMVGATYNSAVNEIQAQWSSFTYVCDGFNWFII
ncbi:MAG TPA: hypothetical protein VI911_11430 [Patescibacteria group bacterium]|nr:hypothetical protein [Patescibacteria group bacterium]